MTVSGGAGPNNSSETAGANWKALTWPAVCEHNGMRAEKHAWIPDFGGSYCGYCGVDRRDAADARKAQEAQL